jgi:unsaturated rhamnogalacturonyl hydrolase
VMRLTGGMTLAALAFAPALHAQSSEAPWSVRFANAVMARNPQVYAKWDYSAGLVLLAIERAGEQRHDQKMLSYVKNNVDRFVQPDGAITGYKPSEFNLDQIAEGRLLFPLSESGGDARYMRAAALLHDQLTKQPRTAEGGFWHKQIYPQQMWLDGLYMAEPFYAEYAQRAHDAAAFDDVAKQFLLLARHARDPSTGLMYHGYDAARAQKWADPATGLSQNFWGRGMGWYMVAAVDVLDYLPADHRDRAAIIRTLKQAADAVTRVQDPVTGLWWQVLDQPNKKGNYLEASASSMFTYALAKGVRKGYLDPRYRAVASRGFDGIVANLVKTGSDGLPSLTGICQVAGLGGALRKDGSYRDGSFAYYVSEPVVADDFKGVGPFIMAALELGR